MTKVQVDSNGKVITLGGKALVASEGGSATLITKNITQNGTYNASSDNADGYSSVTVNVAGITPTGTLSITTNGVYDVTNYASANVNVSDGSNEVILFNYNDGSGETGATTTAKMKLCRGNLSSYSATEEVAPVFNELYHLACYYYIWKIEPNTDYTLFYQTSNYDYTPYAKSQVININVDTRIRTTYTIGDEPG